MKAPLFGLRLSRRDLLRAMARLAALGGLALLASRLLGGSPRATPAAGLQSCVGDLRCRGCGALDACGMPQALSYRERAGGRV